MTIIELISHKCQSILGHNGKMVSLSKSDYREKHPKNFVIFNSNIVCIEGKVWYGDIDLTLSADLLREIAILSEELIYVLYEMDARFENEKSPKLERAAVIFYPDGSLKIREDLSKTYQLS
jgi:hypothetical protein